MNEKIRVGDQVHLKSGNGPMMVVDEINEDGICLCKWFDDQDSPKSESFKVAILDRFDPDAPAPWDH